MSWVLALGSAADSFYWSLVSPILIYLHGLKTKAEFSVDHHQLTSPCKKKKKNLHHLRTLPMQKRQISL